MKITYKTITPENGKKYHKWLITLMSHERNTPKELLITLKNSPYIIIALDSEKIVWCFQIISDRYYIANLVNLLVNPDYRKYWIWWKLTDLTVEKARKMKVKNINLVPDPRFPWLKDFYAKHWFEKEVGMYIR